MWKIIIMGKVENLQPEKGLDVEIKLIIIETTEKGIIKWKGYVTRLWNMWMLTRSDLSLMPYNEHVLLRVSTFPS